ncbi:hypothetical protein OIU76_030137 [Salix suchowensis]|nr:hypothetical protein OIU76_030137 [Salix suchowensis]
MAEHHHTDLKPPSNMNQKHSNTCRNHHDKTFIKILEKQQWNPKCSNTKRPT